MDNEKGEFFFYFIHVFLVLNDIYRCYMLSKGAEGFSTGNYGDNRPNDVSGIVWANSKFFFSFLSFLYY